MKKIYYVFALLLSLVVASCTSDEMGIPSKEVGYLKLDMNTVVTPITRASVVNNPADYAPKQLYVEIVDANNEVVMSTTDFENDTNWKGQRLPLKVGTYTINAHSNGWDGSGSGFDTPYYAGSTTATISANTNSTATITCTQANVKVTVKFDQTFIDNFTSATSTFSSSVLGVTEKVFTMGTTAGPCEKSAYFPAGDLQATLSVMNKASQSKSQTNTISGAKARDHYIITYKLASGTLGGKTDGDGINGVNVVINDETHTYEYIINVGYPSDISIDFGATASYVSAAVTGQVKTTSAAIKPSCIALQYREKGTEAWTDVPNASLTTDANGNVSYTITGLRSSTTYEYRINYDDAETGLSFISDPKELTTTAFFSNLTATSYNPFSAELAGTIGEASAASNVTLQWKTSNATSWTTVASNALTINGTSIKYSLGNLNQTSTYQFRLVCSNPALESETKTFQTLGVKNTQLKNAGFENWYFGGAGNAVAYPNVQGETYWDSSNPGSAGYMEDKAYNVTTQSTSYHHSGNSCVRLGSMWVSIKFAAASLYTGQFVELIGTKGAKLKWGVPFTDMPTALKGFRIAMPGPVSRTPKAKDNITLPSGCPQMGETDHQQIYCALLTEQLKVANASNNDGYEMCTEIDWENDSRVIAYGELTINTSDEDWTEFTIPFKYHGSVRAPKYLFILASSSKFGDYFHGGETSILYLDDLELVYDGNYTIK